MELAIIAVLLLVSGIAHGYNMFHFPAYFDDEGTYIAQAWSVVARGQLSHYTYWYDHPPVGWIQIGIFSSLLGGFNAFKYAINTGRVFMFLIHLFTTLLLFLIAKKITTNKIASITSTIIYAVSPLVIGFSRMVFLDNIMVFWLLLSIYIILYSRGRLTRFVFSAIAFSVGVLSKEIGLVFLPAFLYLIFKSAHKHNRVHVLVDWIAIVFAICSFWILYAFLKNELFPMGSLFDAGGQHVSLISTIEYQLSRKGEGNIFQYPSDFWNNVVKWSIGKNFFLLSNGGDGFFIIGGFLSLLVTFFKVIKRNVNATFVFISVLLYIIFLGKGGQVLEFYIIPLLPFLTLSIALALDAIFTISKRVFGNTYLQYSSNILVSFLILGSMQYVNINNLKQLLFSKPTSTQTAAIDWIGKNINKEAFIVVDDFSYVDLKNRGFDTPNPIYYWKVDNDPIVTGILQNNWRNIEYVIFTPSVRADLPNLPLVDEAVKNSSELVSFDYHYADGKNTTSYFTKILKVENEKDMLSESWNTYKETFLKSGAIYDPYTQRITSEGQAYFLLRAVYADDKAAFDEVWQWTQKNIQLEDNSLFAWLSTYDGEQGEAIIKDKGTATDADQDIALALLLAYKKWGDTSYLSQAKDVVNNIWEQETVEIQGKRYIVAGDWASKPNNKLFTINPSYLSPYAYRIFAEVDKNHDWLQLVDTSYELLSSCTKTTFDLEKSANIPPDWCAINKNGQVVKADITNGSTNYSYDAMRTLWRVALDYSWYGDERALTYLNNMPIWAQEWESNKSMYASYTHDGKALANSESLAHYGSQLSQFAITNKDIAEQIYKEKIYAQWNEGGFWSDKNNYYDQNWAWFGTALYTNNLPNLWTQ